MKSIIGILLCVIRFFQKKDISLVEIASDQHLLTEQVFKLNSGGHLLLNSKLSINENTSWIHVTISLNSDVATHKYVWIAQLSHSDIISFTLSVILEWSIWRRSIAFWSKLVQGTSMLFHLGRTILYLFWKCDFCG